LNIYSICIMIGADDVVRYVTSRILPRQYVPSDGPTNELSLSIDMTELLQPYPEI